MHFEEKFTDCVHKQINIKLTNDGHIVIRKVFVNAGYNNGHETQTKLITILQALIFIINY